LWAGLVSGGGGRGPEACIPAEQHCEMIEVLMQEQRMVLGSFSSLQTTDRTSAHRLAQFSLDFCTTKHILGFPHVCNNSIITRSAFCDPHHNLYLGKHISWQLLLDFIAATSLFKGGDCFIRETLETIARGEIYFLLDQMSSFSQRCLNSTVQHASSATQLIFIQIFPPCYTIAGPRNCRAFLRAVRNL
jgi:hypothetical protein